MNDSKLNWGNVLFLTISPIAAIACTIWYTLHYGVHWMEIVNFFIFYSLTAGLGISAGYHRYFAHKSYQCHPALEILYLVFGAASLQNSVLRWSRDHRVHHQHIDQEEDPYNIKKGAFHAHIGWIFYDDPEDRDFSNVPDLLKNKWVVWQDRYYLLIAIVVGFGLPTLIGWSVGRPFGGFLWGGLLRTVIVHHLTFFINSLAHMTGKRPFTEAFSARDSWWLSFLTCGEGFHNFHHRFASDYRNSYRWYHWDPTKWWVRTMHSIGLVNKIQRYRKDQLLKANLETEMERMRRRMAEIPKPLGARIEKRLQMAREQLEAAAVRWEKAKLRYQTMKSSAFANSRKAKALWKLKIREYRLEVETAQAKWKLLLASASRLSERTFS